MVNQMIEKKVNGELKYVEPFCLTSLSIEVEKRWLQLTGLWKIQIFEVSLHADNLVTILARQKK